MCGFAGLISQNKDVQYCDLQKMQKTLNYRGPDSFGIWINDESNVGFFHNRLSILDISNAGSQPMFSKSKRYVIAFNGEIYNHLLLRNEVKSKFIGTSDTETLLTCFEEWGVEVTLKKASGMFSFALWDSVQNFLYLSRDRFGEKPLYYGWQDTSFFFGSELKAFRCHPNFNSKICTNALSMFFRYSYIPEPRSIYKDIFKLKPGAILKINPYNKEIVASTYWDLNNVVDNSISNPFTGNESEVITELDFRLNQIISNQQLSDRPIGVFLSGGIDSTLVSSIMQSQSNTKINTFTVGFDDSKYNESVYSKKISNYLNTNHHELIVGSKDISSIINDIANIYDEPFADSSQIPTYFVSKLAKEHVTVSLSGDGGDEIFGGYNRYQMAGKLNAVPPFYKNLIINTVGRLKPREISKIYNLLKPFIPDSFRSSNAENHFMKIIELMKCENKFDIYQSLCSISQNPSLLLKNSDENNGINICLEEIFSTKQSFEYSMMICDTLTYLPDDILVKLDRASMAVSLECRAPFLDHNLAEFAYSLPLNYKIKNGKGKWILRQLLNKYVPSELFERPKMGFGLPLDSMLRNDLKDIANELLTPLFKNNDEFLNGIYIKKIWDEHQRGFRNHQFVLWNIIIFQLWRRQWL